MRKKTATHEESKSLRTFFLYAALVFLLIALSLSIKVFTVIQHSKFDSHHQFVLAIASKGKVDQVIAFYPTKSLSVLELEGKTVPLANAGKTLGVPLNGRIDALSALPQDNVSSLLTGLVIHYNAVKTDITIYDLMRFIWLAKNSKPASMTKESLKLPQEEREVDKTIAQLFTDEAISSENTSIQIINATDTPGMGKRLERVISNMGGNVVAVSTLQKKQQKSKIEYFGEKTYALEKLQNMLSFPVSKLGKEAIANIVVTIGEDSKNPTEF